MALAESFAFVEDAVVARYVAHMLTPSSALRILEIMFRSTSEIFFSILTKNDCMASSMVE